MKNFKYLFQVIRMNSIARGLININKSNEIGPMQTLSDKSWIIMINSYLIFNDSNISFIYDLILKMNLFKTTDRGKYRSTIYHIHRKHHKSG